MEITNIIPICFNRVFDETPLNPSEYLKFIPREVAIRYSLLMANYTAEDSVVDQIKVLNLHKYLPVRIFYKLMDSHQPNCRYVLFTPHCGLELTKTLCNNPIDNQSIIKNTNHIYLLKAILRTNSILLSQGSHFKDKSLDLFAKEIRSYKYDLDDRVTVFPSVYRAFCLLHFLENNTSDKWMKIHKHLLQKLEFDSLRQYLNHSFNILGKLNLTPKKSNSIFLFRERGTQLSKLINAISFDIRTKINNIDNQDYTYFKEYPFIRLSDSEYGVVSNIFVANLIYSKLKFCIRDICQDNNICNFFTYFNNDFIEKYLFINILKYSFSNSCYICLSENDFSRYFANATKKDRDSLPDGYVRHQNKILLFECKGKIISISAMQDENKCRADIGDVVGRKGTGQLIRNCDRIIQNHCFWDNNIPSDFMIYPFLILDDGGFSSSGFNRYVVEQTQDYINFHRSCVFPFTILDIDTFILIADLIKNNVINIFDEIESYHSYINRQGEYESMEELFLSSNVSFATFIKSRYETTSPSIINEWYKNL